MTNLRIKNNRLLRKLAAELKYAKTRSAEPQCTLVHEDSSNESTKYFNFAVEFSKKSNNYEIILPSTEYSEQFAMHLGQLLQDFLFIKSPKTAVNPNCSPLILGFSGDIGMGKTTIIRGLLRTLGVIDRIKSPTYSLVESYKLDNLEIHHFDLYRIQEKSELDYFGFRDYFHNNTLSCIEWPENLQDYALDLDILVTISRYADGRCINLRGLSGKGLKFIQESNWSLD